jgi:putative glutamine amidotransferase
MKKLIGLTGPSSFTTECVRMIEKHFETDFVLLYHENESNLKSWMERCDAFVVAGGVDIHPSIYESNILSKHNLSKFDLQRDMRELMVIDYALNKKIPMLGICRGHQLIGIALGMKPAFCMDLTDSQTVHQAAKAGIALDRNEPIHSVKLIGSFSLGEVSERKVIKDVMMESQGKVMWVNSFHHQGIFHNDAMNYQQMGVEVIGIASAQMDKKSHSIIELMRGDTWLSCQWHPEYDYDINTPSKAVLDNFKKMMEAK